MRFNLKAFLFGFLGLGAINAFFAGMVWFLAEFFSVQFEDTLNHVLVFLFVPSIVLNTVWFTCIFRLFNNGPKYKEKQQSNAMATPEGTNYRGMYNSFKFERHNTRTFLLVSSIIALTFSLVLYFGAATIFHIESSYNYEADKQVIICDKAPLINVFAKKLNKELSIWDSVKNSDSKIKTGVWQSVFANNLDCFLDENNAYTNKIISNYDFVNEIPSAPLKLCEKYEFWIDPDDPKKFKIRYKALEFDKIYTPTKISFFHNQESNAFISRLNFDKRLSSQPILQIEELPTDYRYKQSNIILLNVYFTKFIQPSPDEIRFEYSLQNSAFIPEIQYFHYNEYGYFVYDSSTKEFRFEFDGFWENFFEHQKLIFYIIWYLFGFAICILIFKIMRRLAKSNCFKGKHHSKTTT